MAENVSEPHSLFKQMDRALIDVILENESSEDRVKLVYIEFRKTLTPEGLIKLIIDYSTKNGLDHSRTTEFLEELYSRAKNELPLDDAYRQNLIFKELAPFYDRVGEVAIYFSLACQLLEGPKLVFRAVGTTSNATLDQIASVFLDHVGNAKYGLMASYIPKVFEALFSKGQNVPDMDAADVIVSKKIIDVIKEVAEIFFPYLLITFVLAYQIDTETAQVLPGSFGTPDLRDMVPGLVSVVALAKLLENRYYARPYAGPLGIKENQERPSPRTPLMYIKSLFKGKGN